MERLATASLYLATAIDCISAKAKFDPQAFTTFLDAVNKRCFLEEGEAGLLRADPNVVYVFSLVVRELQPQIHTVSGLARELITILAPCYMLNVSETEALKRLKVFCLLLHRTILARMERDLVHG